uniref:(northern house mosquito) hypothetical protein n=1 Tax=Culex pipiens TaxID=7175 RepID=A0A8D8CKT3_CULPI
MEEAAIAFVVDAAKDPPVKTAQQQKLPTDFILPIHQQLPQQQLVTSRLQQRLQQRHPHRCDPQQRFQQQPVSSQRCRQQPCGAHQVARGSSSSKGPADAVDRSACSSTRGGCTERRVKDTQPEFVIPAKHPTRPTASINAFAVDGKSGCADVIKRVCHVSTTSDDVTAVHHSTTKNPVHIKAHRFLLRRTQPSAASATKSPRRFSSVKKIEGGEKERTGIFKADQPQHHLQLGSNVRSQEQAATTSSSESSTRCRSTWCRLIVHQPGRCHVAAVLPTNR